MLTGQALHLTMSLFSNYYPHLTDEEFEVKEIIEFTKNFPHVLQEKLRCLSESKECFFLSATEC